MSPSNPPSIFRLPTELLTSIFTIVADLEEPRAVASLFGLPDGTQTFIKWVKLMLVCWRWREVGLSSPCLWRRISITKNLESLEFRLSRAVGCTVDLFLRNNAPTNESAMPLLLRFALNIWSIQIGDSFCFDVLPSIKPLFEVPLPSLESVALLSGQSMWSRFDRDSPDESKGWFDLGLSGDLHPRLSKLHVHRILIPPPPAICSTLRELVIDLKGLKNPPLTLQDVLNVLAHSSSLEIIKIFSSPTWAYPSVSQVLAGVEPSMQSRCSLPDLREVFLRCPYQFATSILQAIDALNLVELRVEAFTNTPLVVTEIGSDLLPLSLCHPVPRFSKLRLVPNHPSGFYIGGSASLIPGRHYRSGDPNCFRVDIAVRDSTGVTPSLDAALTTLCSAFAGAPLEQLDIADFDDLPSLSAWKRLCTTFPAVASLRLTCSGASVVISFLLDFLTASIDGLWLGLCRISISTTHKDYGPLDSSHLYVIFELLLDILRARWERNASDMVLGLEHTIKRWMPLFPHRWMLHTMAALCGGKFTLRRCEDNARRGSSSFEVEVSELFAPAELRRLPRESGEADGSLDEGEVPGEVEDTDDLEISTDEDLPLDDDATTAAGIHADEREEVERSEYLTLLFKVLEELRQTVPRKSI